MCVQITEYEKDLADCRLLISQHEARMKTLQESMREAENKKRTLEEDVDALREECAKLKAAGEFCPCNSHLVVLTCLKVIHSSKMYWLKLKVLSQ